MLIIVYRHIQGKNANVWWSARAGEGGGGG